VKALKDSPHRVVSMPREPVLPPGPPRTGRYVYAVVLSSQALPERNGRVGIDGQELYAVAEGRVAAVVSNVPNQKIRPERRHLAAHYDVLKWLMKSATVLPMAFGVIADGPKALRRILSLNEASFVEQIRRVQGKVEMGVRACWDVPNIFEYFVSTHPELRALRDQLFRAGAEPSQVDKIELGRMFDRILTEDRLGHTEAVIRILRPYCAEIKENKPRTEREIMNLACLVAQDAQKGFEQGVFEAAKRFDSNYAFDFSGPFPPANFVEVDLRM